MSETVVIGRVRIADLTGFRKPVRSRTNADPLLLRLRAAHLLETADLLPPGLPPGAILTIRRLTDPLPGRFSLDAGQLAPDRSWQAALSAQLSRLAAQAERPLQGAVAASAQAVLFADQGELLACLALDWLAGQLLNRWWWREVVRRGELAAVVAAAWLGAPEAAPAALGHLNRRGAAVTFLRKLDDGDAAALLTAVIERHGLSRLQPALDASLRGGADRPAAAQALQTGAGPADAAEAPTGTTAAVSAPWSASVPAESANLSPARQMLLGVGLGLVYSGPAVRTAAYAERAVQWAEGRPADFAEAGGGEPQRAQRDAAQGASDALTAHEQAGQTQQAGEDRAEARGPAQGDGRAEAASARPEAGARTPRSEHGGEAQGTAPRKREDGDQGASATAEGRDQGNAAAEDAAGTGQAAADAAADVAAGAEAAPASTAPAPAQVPDAALDVSEVRTAYAGLFYLVNAALGLGLYADFTQPDSEAFGAGSAAVPSPWAFLALIGRAFVGEALEADPVWGLLARLAGVEGDFAAGFVPPDGLSVADWVEGTTDAVAAWIADQCAAAAYPEPWADRAELADGMLARAGRVRLAAGRLDVTLALDELDIRVRLAGLDRNPGWVPAAGRAISFHYV